MHGDTTESRTRGETTGNTTHRGIRGDTTHRGTTCGVPCGVSVVGEQQEDDTGDTTRGKDRGTKCGVPYGVSVLGDNREGDNGGTTCCVPGLADHGETTGG